MGTEKILFPSGAGSIPRTSSRHRASLWSQRSCPGETNGSIPVLGKDTPRYELRLVSEQWGHAQHELLFSAGTGPDLLELRRQSTKPPGRPDRVGPSGSWQCGQGNCNERIHLTWHQITLRIYDKGEAKQNRSLYLGCSAGQRALAWGQTLLGSGLPPLAELDLVSTSR